MLQQSICITPSTFNPSKLIIEEAKEFKTKHNLTNKTSKIAYLNDKDEKCQLFITCPSFIGYAPYPQYKYGSTTKNLENITNYSIQYINNRTERLFKKIQEIIQKKIKSKKLKPIFSENKNGQSVAYFKTKGKIDSQLKLYKDKECSEELQDIQEIVGKYGCVIPMLHLDNIYFGSHGNSDYTSSLRAYISKLIFIEKENVTPDFVFEDD